MADLGLVALGAGAPYPRPSAACSGLLLHSGATNVWLDAGGGTLATLQGRIGLPQLGAIWISHLHADHLSDLPLAYYAWLMAPTPLPRIPLFGPPGLADRVEAFLRSAHRLDRFFDVIEMTDGDRYSVGGISLTVRSVEHGIPAFAVRADAEGRSIVYSGDTGPSEALVALAERADALVCESGYATAPAPGEARVHCTPEDAASMASRAAVRSLALYHLALGLDESAAVNRARSVFAGPVRHLRQGEEI